MPHISSRRAKFFIDALAKAGELSYAAARVLSCKITDPGFSILVGNLRRAQRNYDDVIVAIAKLGAKRQKRRKV